MAEETGSAGKLPNSSTADPTPQTYTNLRQATTHWEEIKTALCGSERGTQPPSPVSVSSPPGIGPEHGLRPSPDLTSERATVLLPLASSSPRRNARLPAPPLTPYLVTDQIPLLLIVILPQKPGLVGRQVHGALRREPESMGLNAPPTWRREQQDYAHISPPGPSVHPGTPSLVRKWRGRPPASPSYLVQFA